MARERVAVAETEEFGDVVLVFGLVGLIVGVWLHSPAVGTLAGIAAGTMADALVHLHAAETSDTR